MSNSDRKIPVGNHETVIRRSVDALTEREDEPAKTQPITELYSRGRQITLQEARNRAIQILEQANEW